MSQPLLVAAALALAALPAAAACPPGAADSVGTSTADSQHHANSLSPLEILLSGDTFAAVPPKDWADQDPVPGDHLKHFDAAVNWALDQVYAATRDCTPEELVPVRPAEAPPAFPPNEIFPPPPLRRALADYAKNNRTAASQLSGVFATPDGVPSPVPLQLAVSQVVSSGQPGFAPTFTVTSQAVNPARQPSAWDHLGGTASALILQPLGGAQGDPQAPQAASFEVVLSTTSERTAADWYQVLADQAGSFADKFAAERADAVRRLFSEFRERTSAAEVKAILDNPATTPAARAELLQPLFYVSAAAAYAQFDAFAQHDLKEVFSALNLGSDPPIAGTNLRLRVSPQAQYLPDVPNLLSLSVGAYYRGVHVRVPKQHLEFGTSGLANLAASAFPTPLFDHFSADPAQSQANIGLELAERLFLQLPVTAGADLGSLGSARFSLGLTARASYAPPISPGTTPFRGAAGLAASLEMPVTTTMALVASFRGACRTDFGSSAGCYGVTSITFSVAPTPE